LFLRYIYNKIKIYQLVQNATTTVNGISIDDDATQTDNKGGNVLWLAPALLA
jgi:hypothetical protein